MKKGQMFSLDLVIALVLIVATLAAVVQLKSNFEDRASESFRSAKLHQLADDAAAFKYYNESGEYDFSDFQRKVRGSGYVLREGSAPGFETCFKGTRGTENEHVGVMACEIRD